MQSKVQGVGRDPGASLARRMCPREERSIARNALLAGAKRVRNPPGFQLAEKQKPLDGGKNDAEREAGTTTVGQECKPQADNHRNRRNQERGNLLQRRGRLLKGRDVIQIAERNLILQQEEKQVDDLQGDKERPQR
jgi:hypothetical protein